MTTRPALDRQLDGKTFRDYYYLKEELADFCRKNGLPASGGKLELTERIAHYLDTGEVQPVATAGKRGKGPDVIREDTIIEPDFVCSERHRAFFRARIGETFAFHVGFQKWLKNNPGKTYGEAIAAYDRILEEKKKGGGSIERQFEYNTYIRDFFADNQGRSLEEAIACWKYKKQQKGQHHYESADLAALEAQR